MLYYDSETGKGDHRRVGDDERPHTFTGIEALLGDFWADVDAWENNQ